MNQSIKRVLISVSDKQGVVELATSLSRFGVDILSTGGTAKLLSDHGIAITEVSEHTGFPEIMDGRVKTLHPKIHGGLLGRKNKDEVIMKEHNIDAIDMLIVNLYPFEEAIKAPDCTLENAIENIDIGGPAMLRAAAKNYERVTVVVNPDDYSLVTNELEKENGHISLSTRKNMSAKAFAHTAAYDSRVATYLHQNMIDEDLEFPSNFLMPVKKKLDLRYGENPHQKAAFYTDSLNNQASISTAVSLQGKALSFNNIADGDAALECVKQFKESACVIVKHANPCGVALSDNQLEAYLRAYETDTESAFGGILAFNRELKAETAKAILENQFVEMIIAPSCSQESLVILQTKQNIRVLTTGNFDDSHTPI